MLILPKRGSAPSTPGTDKITLYANTNEKLAYVNDLGTVFVPTFQTGASSWTPSVQFGGGTTGITYSTQVGRYVRIGDMVVAAGYAVMTSKGSSTGSATFATLPVNGINVSSMFQAVNIWVSNMTGVAGHIQGFITPSAAGITLSYVDTGSVTTLNDTNFNNNTSFMITASYLVDA